jgi:hypothetical protein
VPLQRIADGQAEVDAREMLDALHASRALGVDLHHLVPVTVFEQRYLKHDLVPLYQEDVLEGWIAGVILWVWMIAMARGFFRIGRDEASMLAAERG